MTGDDTERRLAEALRAQAAGGQRPGLSGSQDGTGYGYGPRRPRRAASRPQSTGVGAVLLLALLVGVVIGVVLALMSLGLPGVLPPIG
ncbi:MAG: hypothetical protein L0H84_13860 [Pseudonocardia sp.]|nr:hypothetical protein [Pseudonocardia sp.]